MCKNCYGTGKIRKKVMPGVYTFKKCNCPESEVIRELGNQSFSEWLEEYDRLEQENSEVLV